MNDKSCETCRHAVFGGCWIPLVCRILEDLDNDELDDEAFSNRMSPHYGCKGCAYEPITPDEDNIELPATRLTQGDDDE